MEHKTSELDDFYALSVTLTGFSLFDLQGTGVGAQYYEAARRHGGASLTELLARYREIVARAEDSHARLEHALRVGILADPTLGPLARNIAKAWYLGSWDLGGGDAPIVSPEAYQEGLVWQAIEAHPMGAKQQGWGTWAEPPGVDLVPERNLAKR